MRAAIFDYGLNLAAFLCFRVVHSKSGGRFYFQSSCVCAKTKQDHAGPIFEWEISGFFTHLSVLSQALRAWMTNVQNLIEVQSIKTYTYYFGKFVLSFPSLNAICNRSWMKFRDLFFRDHCLCVSHIECYNMQGNDKVNAQFASFVWPGKYPLPLSFNRHLIAMNR